MADFNHDNVVDESIITSDQVAINSNLSLNCSQEEGGVRTSANVNDSEKNMSGEANWERESKRKTVVTASEDSAVTDNASVRSVSTVNSSKIRSELLFLRTLRTTLIGRGASTRERTEP